MSEANSRSLRIVAGISIILTIAWNYLANTGSLYGIMIKDISDKYFNLFTPAGFTFLIWGVIYIGLIALAIALFRSDAGLVSIRSFSVYVILQSVFNCLWIHFFLSDMPGVALLLIVLLLLSLIKLLQLVSSEDDPGFLTSAVVGLYAGWVTVATIANASVLLMAIDWSGWSIAPDLWYRLLTIVAAIIGGLVMLKKNNSFYPIAIAWGLVGIAANHTDDTALYYQALIPAFFLGLFVLSRFVKGVVKKDA